MNEYMVIVYPGEKFGIRFTCPFCGYIAEYVNTIIFPEITPGNLLNRLLKQHGQCHNKKRISCGVNA